MVKLIKTINQFAKWQVTKSIHKNQLPFYIQSQKKKKVRKPPHFKSQAHTRAHTHACAHRKQKERKKIKYLEQSNKGDEGPIQGKP